MRLRHFAFLLILSAAVLAPAQAPTTLPVERRLIASGQGYFPVALRLADGRIAVVMRGGAPHVGLKGRLDMAFSSDEGQTWSKPTVVVDSGIDDRNPALGQAADGTLVVAYWHNTRYDAAGQYNSNLDTPVSTWTTRSGDGGKTWSKPVQINVSDIGWGSPYGKVLTLPDGSMLMAVYGGAVRDASKSPTTRPKETEHSYVYRSTDNGQSWLRFGQPGPQGFNETGLLRLPSGVILAAMRRDPGGTVCLTRSADGGKTWAEPSQPITPNSVHPADLTLLPDGRVLMVCGDRVGPYGVRGLIGDASGDFDRAGRIRVVTDATNGDCGYPSSVMLKDGRILTAYYAVGSKDNPSWGTHCGAVIYASPAAAPPRIGDEGMWTLNNLPLRDLKARYNFEPAAEWLKHVQLSAVRFGGASGAFVSPDGLVITNHHVALGQLQKVSTPERDYVRNGFFARTREQEMRCPDQELNVLVSLEDVTGRVLAAVDPKASDQDRNRQRKAEIARIEKEAHDRTGLRCDVVELYQGGEYWLYSYKKYTDVRLVMAPEYQAAFFGGDYDNFTYPRYCLDFAFFRAYENGQPAKIEHYLRWSKAGAGEGELVFVAGHPGSTNRLRTAAQLQFERDRVLPMRLRTLNHRRDSLYEYAKRGAEQARQVKTQIFGVENGLKSLRGRYEGLQEPSLMDRLAAAEQALRQQVLAKAELAREAGQSWDRIAGAVKLEGERYDQQAYYAMSASRPLDIARTIVRYVAEVEKPNDRRYEEFRDSALSSMDFRLFSPAPIYPELEEYLLADSLAEARAALGNGDKLIAAAIGDRDPKALARELIAGTKLADPAVRRALVKGGRAAVEASSDPLITYARKLDPIWREQRDWHENNVQSVVALEGGKIARARFAVYGRETYPDATGTLRLSFGRVLGYELLTTRVPWKTTFFGLYARAASFENRPPFDLPKSIATHRADLDLSTPLDMITTNDIVGGNSGSPVINRDGEYVGLIFDGNIHGLVGYYAYEDEKSRAIAVHSSAIVEALRHIYDMSALADELK